MSVNSFKLEITKETETVSLSQPVELSSIEDRINALAAKYLSGNLPVSAVIFSFNPEAETGVTVIPEADDAFQLVSAVAGSIRSPDGIIGEPRTVVREDRTGAIAINRSLIGYSAASRFADLLGNPEGERQFLFSMIGMVNTVALQFMTELGVDYVRGCKIRAERPGQEGVYFRDAENVAAYEIRFTLYKE